MRGWKTYCLLVQVWDLTTSTCTSILETPRDDLVAGVDFALNCLVKYTVLGGLMTPPVGHVTRTQDS